MTVAQRADRRGQETAGSGGERGDAQFAGDGAAVACEVGLDRLDLGEQSAGVLGEQPRGVGEADAAPARLQQALPDLTFEPAELLRDGRRRDVQDVGGPADRARGGDRVQHAQPFQVQHIRKSNQWWREGLDCAEHWLRSGWVRDQY